ncbi:hypothetical protein BD289DRAFT_49728 [Coniella lustricola]|uniref:Uncharacterized protein n=1 Tax=Coniella lustricola TaxID=2025994 RepID=A0A2T3A1F7_9PEZI|nr:hypothetical protein BD289DRAFT_49728 [Coniella lustricola]
MSIFSSVFFFFFFLPEPFSSFSSSTPLEPPCIPFWCHTHTNPSARIPHLLETGSAHSFSSFPVLLFVFCLYIPSFSRSISPPYQHELPIVHGAVSLGNVAPPEKKKKGTSTTRFQPFDKKSNSGLSLSLSLSLSLL